MAEKSSDAVSHPSHYGGADNPYEAIKVIEAWDLGFHLGNVVKYLARAGRKGDALEDLRKARWYLDRAIERGLVPHNRGALYDYGEPLRAHNGRVALVDLYQEVLDAAMYVRQLIEERGGMPQTGGGDG